MPTGPVNFSNAIDFELSKDHRVSNSQRESQRKVTLIFLNKTQDLNFMLVQYSYNEHCSELMYSVIFNYWQY